MHLNDDFTARVLMHADALDWQSSPSGGVERKPLDRIGGEVARATSIVRFGPGSQFDAHTHGGGEEFLVLEGVFQDEEGDYPVGSYVRNPPGSRHTPRSDMGCTILVKLWQFRSDDSTTLRVAPGDGTPHDDGREGVAVKLLHRDAEETVTLEEWAPGTKSGLATSGGAEIFVLDGSIEEGSDCLSRWSWLRLPDGYGASFTAGPEGARIWVKTGHLSHIRTPDAA